MSGAGSSACFGAPAVLDLQLYEVVGQGGVPVIPSGLQVASLRPSPLPRSNPSANGQAPAALSRLASSWQSPPT